MYACIYFRKGQNWQENTTNLFNKCKIYHIRCFPLTHPSDLPDIYKNKGAGAILDPNIQLKYIANMLRTDTDWETVQQNIPEIVIEPVMNLTDQERDQLNAYFDARIKAKYYKGNIYFERVDGAPQLPSVQAETESALSEVRQAAKECKTVDKIAYQQVLDSVCTHLFDLFIDKYITTIRALTELSDGIRRFKQQRDLHMCGSFKIEARNTARRYCNYVQANFENAVRKSFEVHKNKLFDCILQFPTYAKYYHGHGSTTKTIESWEQDVKDWFEKHYIAGSGLKLIYSDYIQLLTELGFTDMLQTTTLDPPPTKKARIVILTRKK